MITKQNVAEQLALRVVSVETRHHKEMVSALIDMYLLAVPNAVTHYDFLSLVMNLTGDEYIDDLEDLTRG